MSKYLKTCQIMRNCSVAILVNLCFLTMWNFGPKGGPPCAQTHAAFYATNPAIANYWQWRMGPDLQQPDLEHQRIYDQGGSPQADLRPGRLPTSRFTTREAPHRAREAQRGPERRQDRPREASGDPFHFSCKGYVHTHIPHGAFYIGCKVTYAHTYMHTYIHTYIHTYTRT